MGENEVLNDLGDIRVGIFDLNDGEIGMREMLAIIDEKMDKYRGKEVIING